MKRAREAKPHALASLYLMVGSCRFNLPTTEMLNYLQALIEALPLQGLPEKNAPRQLVA
jgi:hypothetical protein